MCVNQIYTQNQKLLESFCLWSFWNVKRHPFSSSVRLLTMNDFSLSFSSVRFLVDLEICWVYKTICSESLNSRWQILLVYLTKRTYKKPMYINHMYVIRFFCVVPPIFFSCRVYDSPTRNESHKLSGIFHFEIHNSQIRLVLWHLKHFVRLSLRCVFHRIFSIKNWFIFLLELLLKSL